MILAAFHNTLDWTAVGTLALALVTTVSLAFGWRSLRQSQREVEEAHRPVVVPVADLRDVEVGDGQTQRGQPLVPKAGWFLVPIENIGSGPAMDIRVTLDRPQSSGGTGWDNAGWVAGMACGRHVAVPIQVSDGPLQVPAEVERFGLAITYGDVAGKRWKTIATWEPIPGRYIGIRVALA